MRTASGTGYGGVGLHRRARPTRLERWLCLHDMPTLPLWRRRALPHAARLQHPPASTAAGRPPQEKMQAVGTHLAERSRLGSRSELKPRQLQFTRLMKRRFRWWLSALLLYLLSVPIIFILIGFLILLLPLLVAIVSGSRQGASVLLFLWTDFMFYIGVPLSLFSSIFVPPFVLGWLRKRRLRRLRRVRR